MDNLQPLVDLIAATAEKIKTNQGILNDRGRTAIYASMEAYGLDLTRLGMIEAWEVLTGDTWPGERRLADPTA